VDSPTAQRTATPLSKAALVSLALLAGGWATPSPLIVFAASSLTEAFEGLAALFVSQHPGVEVLLSFAGSSTLSLQLRLGSPVDVFASADVAQMRRAEDAGLLAGDATLFATNRPVVIAPRGSGVSRFEDLAARGVALVLAGPEVPAGRYAREAIASFDAAEGGGFASAVLANVVSEEPNVRLVAVKVELGEADAGIVYATDAAAFPGLVVVDLPGAHDPLAVYPIAVTADASAPELARSFVALVLSPAGQAILAAHGFGAPE